MGGSPPLARGTHFRAPAEYLVHRLTPARAGNSFPHTGTGSVCAAHPRSRGELPFSRRAWEAAVGSPPLARGTHDRGRRLDAEGRLTPARARNSRPGGVACHAVTAHPRSRGELTDYARTTGIHLGSPPLARGTLGPGRRRPRGRRLTPARAGNSSGRPAASRLGPAHPRSRGELVGALGAVLAEGGSPPLARGTRLRHSPHVRHGRLTPARAGNSLLDEERPTVSSAHPRSRGELTW